jgi:hypothetical protein
MTDVTIKLGKTLIQHGKSSDRVYLMKLSQDDFPEVINEYMTWQSETIILKYLLRFQNLQIAGLKLAI